MNVASAFRRVFMVALLATLAGCATTMSRSDVETKPPGGAEIVTLTVEPGAINALVYDVNQDGLPDIIATSHGDNRSLVYRQVKPRVFVQEQVVTEVGFHPNNFDIFPSEQGRYLICSAEGRHTLQTYEVDVAGKLKLLHETPVRAPRTVAPFVSDLYGPSLVMIPYGGVSVDLLLGFEPLKGARKEVSVSVRGSQEQVVLADLDQDGKTEALIPAKLADQLWLIRDLGSDAPKKELLRQFGQVTSPVNVAVTDFNADGVPDIIVGLAISRDIVRMVGEGGGKFHDAPPLSFAPNLRDNLTRLVVAPEKSGESYLAVGGIYIVKLYHYTPGAGAADTEWPFVEGRVDGIVTGLTLTDLDNDGWLDLVISKSAGPDYKNGVTVVFGPLLENLPKLQQEP